METDTLDPTAILVAAAEIDLLTTKAADPTTDATIDDIAYRLDLAERIKFAAGEIVDMLTIHLNETMESNEIDVPSVGKLVRSNRPPSTKTRNQDAHRAARVEITRKVSRDRATGEMRPDWRDVAETTFDLVCDTLSVGKPKGGFKKVLGLDPKQYVTSTPNGTTVKLVRTDEG